jgi:hypothetical protein
MVKTLAGRTEGYRDCFGTVAKFHGPVDITYCPDRNLYFSDDRYVQRIGMVSTFLTLLLLNLVYVISLGLIVIRMGICMSLTLNIHELLVQDGGVCNVARKKAVKRNFDGDIKMATFNETCGFCL